MNGRSEQHDYHYSMVIEWDPRDSIYVVTVPELPGCRTHGKTYEEAVKQAQEAIAGWVESARLNGEKVPPPNTFAYWPSFDLLKGSHLALSGDDEDDAQHYQEEEVQNAIEQVKQEQNRRL